MATTAPPVPNSTQGGLLVDSAEAGTPLVSGIASAPANSAAEIVPHTGQANNYDPYLNEQFIVTANLTWSTSQLPGTLLWSSRIHPDECNVFVSHISKMYNAWAGSLDFRVKIAGTGFHAGALFLVRLPPNIDPASLLTLEDITPFEYAIVDPKILDPIDRNVMDQRPILYHYRNPADPNDPNSFGGHFCIYVGIQLNTSSSGATNISLQVSTRAGMDLVFSQIRPIQQSGATAFKNVSTLFTPTATHPLTSDPVYLVVEPGAVVPPEWYYKTANLEGKPNCDFQTITNLKVNLREMRGHIDSDGFVKTQGHIRTKDILGPPPADMGWSLIGTDLDPTPGGTFDFEGEYYNRATSIRCINQLNEGHNVNFSVNWGGEHTGLNGSAAAYITWPSIWWTASTNDTPLKRALSHIPAYGQTQWAPPLQESIVSFEAFRPQTTDTPQMEPVVQTRQMLDMILSGQFKNLVDPSQCVLISVIDKQTTLQVGFLKLYSNGILTTRFTSSRTLYSWENYKFIPIQIQGANAPIPITSAMMVNKKIAFEENGDLELNRAYKKQQKVPRLEPSPQENRRENRINQVSRRDIGLFNLVDGHPRNLHSSGKEVRSSSASRV